MTENIFNPMIETQETKEKNAIFTGEGVQMVAESIEEKPRLEILRTNKFQIIMSSTDYKEKE